MKQLTMFWAVVLFILSIPSALSWDLVEMGDVSMEYKSFFNSVNPYIGVATTESNLKVDVTLFGSGYFRNTIHSQTDVSQYRLVGWNWEFGTRITEYLEIGWWHFSKHTLDYQSPVYRRGWNEDGIILRVRLHRGVQPDAIF